MHFLEKSGLELSTTILRYQKFGKLEPSIALLRKSGLEPRTNGKNELKVGNPEPRNALLGIVAWNPAPHIQSKN